MSSYPLLNFNWVDPSGSTVPIANSTFAYGTLGPYGSSGSNSTYWGSLPVTSLTSNNGNFITKSSNYLTFNVSGIYELTTN